MIIKKLNAKNLIAVIDKNESHVLNGYKVFILKKCKDEWKEWIMKTETNVKKAPRCAWIARFKLSGKDDWYTRSLDWSIFDLNDSKYAREQALDSLMLLMEEGIDVCAFELSYVDPAEDFVQDSWYWEDIMGTFAILELSKALGQEE